MWYCGLRLAGLYLSFWSEIHYNSIYLLEGMFSLPVFQNLRSCFRERKSSQSLQNSYLIWCSICSFSTSYQTAPMSRRTRSGFPWMIKHPVQAKDSRLVRTGSPNRSLTLASGNLLEARYGGFAFLD